MGRFFHVSNRRKILLIVDVVVLIYVRVCVVFTCVASYLLFTAFT